VAGMSCMMVRERVDLPQPDSPTRPRISPSSILRSMPSTALMVSVTLRINIPLDTGKWVLMLLSSRKAIQFFRR